MDEMQCMWFQMELARAYHRLGKLGDALQKLHEIDHVRLLSVSVDPSLHCVCVRTHVRACVHVCMRACVRACVHMYITCQHGNK